MAIIIKTRTQNDILFASEYHLDLLDLLSALKYSHNLYICLIVLFSITSLYKFYLYYYEPIIHIFCLFKIVPAINQKILAEI